MIGSGQFDEGDGAAWRILSDDDHAKNRCKTPKR